MARDTDKQGPRLVKQEPSEYERRLADQSLRFVTYGYDVARNGVRLGWALALIGLGLNLLFYFAVAPKLSFILGAAYAIASMGAAYFVEGFRAHGCNHPRLYQYLNLFTVWLVGASYVLWLSQAVRFAEF